MPPTAVTPFSKTTGSKLKPAQPAALKVAMLSQRKAGAKLNDPQGSMQDIIAVATREFAEKGLSGARIDEIAALTRASKRMIYYYYGSKEALYLTVLEAVYAKLRAAEAQLKLEDLPPEAALKKLMLFSIDFKLANPNFTRLIVVENIHRCEYLSQSKTIQALNTPAIDALKHVYVRGVQAGVFRAGLDPLYLHMTISALSTFNVSNQHTFSLIFKLDMAQEKTLNAIRAHSVDTLLRLVRA
jgi:AcrR family transcriptional regulator